MNRRLHLTNKVVHLCHYEKINNDRIYPKNQFRCQCFISRRNSFGGKTGVSEGIQYFGKAGLSLLEISGKHFRTVGNAGKEIGLYCKIATQPYSTNQEKSKRFRSQFEFPRNRSARNFSENRSREWKEKKTHTFLNLNTIMTGWVSKNSAWSIRFLFPILAWREMSF